MERRIDTVEVRTFGNRTRLRGTGEEIIGLRRNEGRMSRLRMAGDDWKKD
jgi:hypothetical protein